MTFSYVTKISLLLLVISSLMSCKPSDSDVKKLVQQTLDNMVFVEGGTFMMGDGGSTYTDDEGKVHHVEFWTGYEDNKPAHKVTLDSYYIQKYEVTYAEFDVFSKVKGLPLVYEDRIENGSHEWLRLPKQPAGVSWYAANEYCGWVGEISGYKVNLPTEAQWEYAARSRGKTMPYATDTGFLEKGVNYNKHYQGLKMKPVGIHPPNPMGLFDMFSNANEWVNDWYSNEYYKNSPEKNPPGPISGEKKVLRGGSIVGGTQSLNTLYNRFTARPDIGFTYYGFRCVVNLDRKSHLKVTK